MQQDYKPFERPERPSEPPEPTIPPGVTGWYRPEDDEFVPDELALEYIGNNYDLQPFSKIAELEMLLIEWMFDDWERIEPE